MNLPQNYADIVVAVSLVLVALWALVAVNAAREYHEWHDERAAWALAGHISAAIATGGLLVSALGFVVVDHDTGSALAAFGLGLARGGLLVAAVALLIQGKRTDRS